MNSNNDDEHANGPVSPQSPRSSISSQSRRPSKVPGSPNGLPTIALAQQMIQLSGHAEPNQTLTQMAPDEIETDRETEPDILEDIQEQEERLVALYAQRLQSREEELARERALVEALEEQLSSVRRSHKQQQRRRSSSSSNSNSGFRIQKQPQKQPQTKRLYPITYPAFQKHPNFEYMLTYLSRKFAPLHNHATREVHRYFPTSYITLYMLTSAQLDSLAVHYHLYYPIHEYSFEYPNPVKPWLIRNENGTYRSLDFPRKIKMRRFARFIGLRVREPQFRCFDPEGLALEREWEEWHGRFLREKEWGGLTDADLEVRNLLAAAAMEREGVPEGLMQEWEVKRRRSEEDDSEDEEFRRRRRRAERRVVERDMRARRRVLEQTAREALGMVARRGKKRRSGDGEDGEGEGETRDWKRRCSRG
ncbi:hypothetical protein BJY04DRAFT_216043 [Aspergillus karnatakaensis]|uniref:uncharacterized protein n=1 Tax=Aspergillus karnatakaensis TaxID=1810916 RepID=UPI003CCD94A6